MQAIFIRHGLAESNVEVLDRTVGQYAALSAEGRRQIAQTAKFLEDFITAKTIYTSPYPRTVQSAEILAEILLVKVEIEPRLQEINKGIWQGRPVEEVIELEAAVDIDDRATFAPQDGENWQTVGTRVANFVEEHRRQGTEQLIMVSHDHPIRMGIGKLLNKPLVTWEDMPIANGSCTILTDHDGVWELERVHSVE